MVSLLHRIIPVVCRYLSNSNWQIRRAAVDVRTLFATRPHVFYAFVKEIADTLWVAVVCMCVR